jgi:tape measure domain-containing protein
MPAAIQYTVGLNANPLVQGVALAINSVKGLAGITANILGNISNLARSMGDVSVAGLSIKGVKLAADLEETATSFEVLLGSAQRAKEMLAEVQQFAAATPFEFPELADAGRKLLAFGSGASDVLNELKSLGAIAKGVGAPIGDLADLYGKARVQGKLMAEDINQLTGRGIPVIQEFAKQFGVGSEKVRKLVEEGKIGSPELQKAIAALTGAGGQFFGMMEKQGKTFNGLLSNLTDSWNDLLRTFGTPIMQGLKPALNEMAKLLDSMHSSAIAWGQAIGDGVRAAVQLFKTGQLGDSIILALKIGGAELVNLVASGLSTALRDVAALIFNADVWVSLAGMVKNAIVEGGTIVAELFRKMNPFTRGPLASTPPDFPAGGRASGGESAEQTFRDSTAKALQWHPVNLFGEQLADMHRELSGRIKAALASSIPDTGSFLKSILEKANDENTFQAREASKKLTSLGTATDDDDGKKGHFAKAASSLAAVGGWLGGGGSKVDNVLRKQTDLMTRMEKHLDKIESNTSGPGGATF